jgi:hypothetical protein
MSIRIAGVCASLMVLANGLSAGLLGQGAAMAEPSEGIANTPTHAFTQSVAQNSPTRALPNLVAHRIRQDLAKRLNVPVDFITIYVATPQVWPDHCLGLGRPTERCQGDEIRGWEVRVASFQQEWIYRSDRTARRLRLSALPGATELNSQEFTAQTAQKLLETVSRQVNQPVSNLQILQVHATSLDGCSSMTTVNTPCADTLTPGFKVIVADGVRKPRWYYDDSLDESLPDQIQREWVYSLNKDGSQVFYNQTASDTQGSMAVFLNASGAENSIPFDSEIIIQQGYIGLNDHRWVTLTGDGLVSLHIDDLEANEPIYLARTIRLQPAEVDAFKSLLEAQNFDDFDGISYRNLDPFVEIHGISTLMAGQTSIELSVFSSDEIPTGLQTIEEALEAWWERLYADE